ncbi:SipW-dependent-type signal peptide-containing protein [uncultured Methanomethylovorans sp.]|uniref:SipW-dependent-type signal peptide-containing protein n=1 Tax=uncultured Methanomethylovorans sp. TaxID=183759 RepID=UPI002AA718BC|nr:SipW-dependent-type signal peptide-containing protein [uncultured Methanomethylovorans sp.]
MNKKILLSLLIIGIIASVASAGTWAYYSAEAQTPAGTLETGKLSLSVPTSVTLGDTDDHFIIPGESATGQIRIINTGNIAGDLYIKLRSNDLTNYFTVTTSKNSANPSGVANGNSITLTTNDYYKVGTLNPNGEVTIPIKYTMGTDVTGGQGIKANFIFDVVLMQKDAPAPTV